MFSLKLTKTAQFKAGQRCGGLKIYITCISVERLFNGMATKNIQCLFKCSWIMFVFKNAFFSSLVEEVGLQKLPCIDKTESSITWDENNTERSSFSDLDYVSFFLVDHTWFQFHWALNYVCFNNAILIIALGDDRLVNLGEIWVVCCAFNSLLCLTSLVV